MADENTPEPGPGADEGMARLRQNRERYGSGYAVMSEVLGGEGIGKITKLVGYAIVAAAAIVVLLAIIASQSG